MRNIFLNNASVRVMLAAAAPALFALSGASVAQASEQAAGFSNDEGDIVVTARKREENLLDTPMAIAAFTSTGLEKRGIDSLSKLTESSPGLNVNQNGAGRNDRSYQQFIIRGFTPSSTRTTTASVFIDGAPVSSTSALSSIASPERIEILKGPQATYFGRATFAGAVNVVTKTPGNDWSGNVKMGGGTRNSYQAHASVEGPIVEDLLAFRLSGDMMGKDGSWKNGFNGETLGNQASRSASLTLAFTPASNLKVKATGVYSRDDDNHPANGLLGMYEIRDDSGNIIVNNQSNCIRDGFLTNGNAKQYPYICGTTPKLAQNPSANTALDPVAKDWLKNVDGRIFNYDKGVQQYGLLRNFYHGNVGMDWEVSDSLTLSSLTAYNREEYSVFIDLDNQGTTNIAMPSNVARPYFDYPYLVERLNQDFSQEVRLSFDNGGPIQATVGASYLNATTRAGVGGGFVPNASYAEMGKTRAKTTGVFGAVTWQATPNFSISGEGRYQEDVLYAYSQPTGTTLTAGTAEQLGMETFYAGGETLFQQKYKNFLPRVIAKYETDGGMMAYASWSKGVNPGAFNTEFLTTPDQVIREAAAQGIGVQVEPEKVTNYEVGLKGQLLDRRLTYSLALYFAEWRNQINAIALYTVDDDNNAFVLQGSANTGSVDMKGVELDLNWRATDNVSINFGGALNDTKIKAHSNPPVSRVTGVTDFTGKELPQTSKWSANVGLEYAGDVTFSDSADWFIRADYAYKSGMWSSAANIVKTMDSHKVNARLGLNAGPLSYELFVSNLFNNKAYTSIGEQSLFEKNFSYSSAYSALVVGLPELRTVGAKVSYKF